jgi:hypothetical protein
LRGLVVRRQIKMELVRRQGSGKTSEFCYPGLSWCARRYGRWGGSPAKARALASRYMGKQ